MMCVNPYRETFMGPDTRVRLHPYAEMMLTSIFIVNQVFQFYLAKTLFVFTIIANNAFVNFVGVF